MLKKLNVWLFAILFLALSQANANPTFSKKYGLKCGTCHSMLPTLNSTGLKFMRNGFRFDRNETTTLDGFLHAKDWKERTKNLPLTALVGFNINSKARTDVDKLILYSGGTLTDTLSFYALTRSNYNTKHNHKLFDEPASRAFLQYNPVGNKHVFKIGWMDPLMGISNLNNRTLMDSGLIKAGLMKKSPKNAIKPSWAKSKPKPPKPASDASPQEKKKYAMAVMPKQPYKTAVPYAGFGLLKGVEYSYLYNDTAMFLVNYGIPTAEDFADDQDDSQLTLAFELQNMKGFNVAAVYLHKEIRNIEINSYVFPVERYFMNEQLLLRTNFVYKDSTQYENPYYGSQSSMTYCINDDSQIRMIYDISKDEAEETNRGLSFTYGKQWNDRVIMHVTAARHKGPVFNESVAKFSLYMFLY
jgi:hypothetical protein